MTAEILFSVCNVAVLPGWLLLVFLPRWRWTTALIAPVLLPGLLGLVYLYLVATHLGNSEGNFSSLAGVTALFGDPWVLLAGWIHYLAFDLFVGSWEVRDARRCGVRHWLVVPCLLLTFLFGPVGLVSYLVVRGVTVRRVLVGQSHAAAAG